ncbi:uncharacterized protein KLLA0_C18755g [Kluyveromyces lactis]|uniref:KLLA0C18755p n=1 Tax=Kluyveromyces lactis (strain ATCC 8585 / CBS 2359 / DSM 70799 / NBRC 1267 / NRRL Y-1140 / WM37) TaxID=284590 RepID=Q6CSQ3_KLULA|nr:uncharacterized protein KLLA0_C18755g [Kluyveromyces lactis]CAH01887.1 KLLA0C18755p [Kluyveromyces lactis]|eukprot:XP_453036.1 uncharacterized protein KLLA0_C18755g [Kluyveromyces lactis]
MAGKIAGCNSVTSTYIVTIYIYIYILQKSVNHQINKSSTSSSSSSKTHYSCSLSLSISSDVPLRWNFTGSGSPMCFAKFHWNFDSRGTIETAKLDSQTARRGDHWSGDNPPSISHSTN